MRPFWIVVLSVVSAYILYAHVLPEYATLPHVLKPGLRETEALALRQGQSAIRHVKTSDYEGYILERINEPAPLTMKDVEWIEKETKILMTGYLNELSKGRTTTHCDYILTHYPEYLRQYTNVSTKEESIVLIGFIAPDHPIESKSFYTDIGVMADGTGRAGWRAKVNLTKRKIEKVHFF